MMLHQKTEYHENLKWLTAYQEGLLLGKHKLLIGRLDAFIQKQFVKLYILLNLYKFIINVPILFLLVVLPTS